MIIESRETRSLVKQLASQLSGSASGTSIITDADYENQVRAALSGILLERCGLEVVRGAEGNRSAFEGMEWDYRVPVLIATVHGDSRSVPGEFEVFPNKHHYERPVHHSARSVTPTQIGSSLYAPAAHYLAILEITTTVSWTKATTRPGLLQRLEQRLTKSLDRAYSMKYIERKCITDLVAVVGVVAPEAYSTSVRDLMAHTDAPPLLKEMMTAGRFVFVRFSKGQAIIGSSSASLELPTQSIPVGRRSLEPDPAIWTKPSAASHTERGGLGTVT